ncbi:phosphinothricin acetyltransferase [Capnocytophaga ochracea]|uniref:Phosphinothricin acetyltransferase n=1 Tax=Capnocytophaga ochracea TaxID=1018 RepID=A0AA46WBK2_CAPOC|nr:phosphinothricin acetyltransferase [Capnocytophaga ochracea]UZD42140.1 phosphinothricin acetyltransferase [Capnocytophaga ochracea]
MYSVSPRTPEGGQAGKGNKPPLLHILRSRDAHTQLSLATFKGGINDGEAKEITNDERRMTKGM